MKFWRLFLAAGIISVSWMPHAALSASAKSLALHPENPHYFLYRGKPAILLGSGEHYGAVLNLDFNYIRYLDELKSRGLNVTRTFSGAYVEPQGAFRIEQNTLAPANGRFIAPWARSATPGYPNGGNKFDLTRWDDAYFKRLKDFLAQANKRGVIVELNLFCPFYEESQWKLSPQNAANNINGVGDVARTNVYTLDRNGGLLEIHDALVRKIVTELKDFDNLYYEICNEPYFGGVTMDWQTHIAEVISETEAKFKSKHLISMNVANGSAKIRNPPPTVSIFNFHYATPPVTVPLNYGLGKPIGDNETGFRGTNNLPYRVEAWEFILAGGALFNHLDYSFTAGHEDGTFVYPSTQPGGGNSVFRAQMKFLKEFLESFDFTKMVPDSSCIKKGVPVGTTARALAEAGKAYAIYIGPTPVQRDRFSVRWIGRIEPKFSETYTFYAVSDDAARLWVKSQPVLANWTGHEEREESGEIALKEGRQHDVRLEYFQNSGTAKVKLLWSSPSQPKAIVPTDRLFLPDGQRHGLQGRYYAGTNFELLKLTRTDAAIDFDWTSASPFARRDGAAEESQNIDLSLELPRGSYAAEWVNPKTGRTEKREKFNHTGGARTLVSPPYDEDIALRIKKN